MFGSNPTPAVEERWHVEVFDESEQLASFLNHVKLAPDQLTNLQFQALSPTIQRILVTCRLTPEQRELRVQWQAVERTMHPATVAVATGGH